MTIMEAERKPKEPLPALVDAALVVEKLRVQSQVRQSHLLLQGRSDPETDELHRRIVDLEKYIDGRVATLLKAHPAYGWFSLVKGIGKENIAKIVGLVDIEKAQTASALWSFAGFAPDKTTGKSMRRTPGEKLHYNSQLRSMCWRVANSLLRAKGKYYEYYLSSKERLEDRMISEGRQVVPAIKLPKENGKKVENESYISEGHIHNMALRLMIKLFLSHLWLEWRQGAGLPIRPCYAIEKLGHSTLITPESMTDK